MSIASFFYDLKLAVDTGQSHACRSSLFAINRFRMNVVVT